VLEHRWDAGWAADPDRPYATRVRIDEELLLRSAWGQVHLKPLDVKTDITQVRVGPLSTTDAAGWELQSHAEAFNVVYRQW
jgi:hypothetical protein